MKKKWNTYLQPRNLIHETAKESELHLKTFVQQYFNKKYNDKNER
jgi:hypothetical protein